MFIIYENYVATMKLSSVFLLARLLTERVLLHSRNELNSLRAVPEVEEAKLGEEVKEVRRPL